MKRKVSISINVMFDDIGVIENDEAAETVKTVLYDMHYGMEKEIASALESIGAKNVKLNFSAY